MSGVHAPPHTDRSARPPWVAPLALFVVLGVVVAGCGSSSAAPSSSAPRTTSAPATTSTTLVSTTTVPARTTTAPGTSSTSSPSTTSTAPGTVPSPTVPIPAGAPVLTNQDAVLKRPASVFALSLGGGSPCAVLTGTSRSGGCGEVTTDGGRTLVWYVSDQDSPDPPAVQVYGVVGTTLVQTLELPDAVRDDESVAHVEAANLDGVPGDELVVGFRNVGTGGYLQLEIIGSAGTVVAHDTVDQGRATVSAGVVDTWAASYGPNDPNCCPGSFVHQQIRFRDGQWRLLTGASVGPKDAPAGQFP